MRSFEANPKFLKAILDDVMEGSLQLPEFQRGWVWNEIGIKELIISVLNDFPIGALMTLEVGGDINFKPRLIEGVISPSVKIPTQLILDGQQRTTSLFLSMYNGKMVETTDDKNKTVKRFYYIDIQKAISDDSGIDESVIIVPESKNFKGQNGMVDLSTPEKEFENLYFPLNMSFNWSTWNNNFTVHFAQKGNSDLLEKLIIVTTQFLKKIIEPLNSYTIPVITLKKHTPKEAVCLVFEKVNTGGKPLDAFELITAVYAADGYNLREDWYGDNEKDEDGIEERIHSTALFAKQTDGVLSGVSSTDFFQVISLLHTEDKHNTAIKEGKTGKAIPQISATKKSLLEIPLEAYKKYRNLVENSFITAGDFLTRVGIYRNRDLPYQSQVTALAAIIAKIGKSYDNTAVFDRLERWFWCGVFGELYGSSIETQIAYDFVQASLWVVYPSSPEPFTIRDANFNIERLNTMRSKLSAAYKGLTTLIAKSGAKDYISGKEYDQTIFMKENVDIDHIFSKKWCKNQKIKKDNYDSIINKTPISPTTNRGVVSGKAPNEFIRDIENGNTKSGAAPLTSKQIDGNLASHLIDPAFLRKDDFEGFFKNRRENLAKLIEQKTGKTVSRV
jgi:hypothetical protein